MPRRKMVYALVSGQTGRVQRVYESKKDIDRTLRSWGYYRSGCKGSSMWIRQFDDIARGTYIIVFHCELIEKGRQ